MIRIESPELRHRIRSIRNGCNDEDSRNGSRRIHQDVRGSKGSNEEQERPRIQLFVSASIVGVATWNVLTLVKSYCTGEKAKSLKVKA